jgi:hypothetical protein
VSNCNGNVMEDENTVVKIKNGMHRARQQQNMPTKTVASKLSPLHSITTSQLHSVKKGEKKTASDESEFSDEDFHFYSDHNGTKMVMISPVAFSESENIVDLYMCPFSWQFA